MSKTMKTEEWVDLRSDTVTRPSPGMRQAMADADVGDDVFGEDPTVERLQTRAAALAQKEAALFVPSGTMANLLAVLAQTRPGDSVILHRDAHPYQYESGNLAAAAGVMPVTLPGNFGILDPEDVQDHIESGADHHRSPTTLISIENTTNRGGGAIYPIGTVQKLGEISRSHGLRLHCDGARIFHALVELGISLSEYAKNVHTLSFCFSKGLGAPVGSILLGDKETIEKAHRFRKMLGGGMRQAGVLAAAALYALENNVQRLKDDHKRARIFREELERSCAVSFPLPSPTNIVYMDVPDAPFLASKLRELGILVLPVSKTRVRAVFHLDIDDEKLHRAIEAFRNVLSS